MNNINGEVTANIVDIKSRTIYHGKLTWQNGLITTIEHQGEEQPNKPYLTPGLIDAHVHIESSMLTPSEFGRQAACHGTVATVSDPHEIANVLGLDGVRFMLESAKHSPCKIFYSAPSCVPATPFETSGARIELEDIATLFDEPNVVALSEMMNFPGVLNGDADVMAKLNLAKQRGYPVDGHAPGVLGEAARRYAQAGISTDHECFSLEEARNKIAAGMVVQIREGSAARNFEALHPLITETPEHVMLCSDDKHPDDLVAGHINRLAARAIDKGHDHFDVLRCICLTPVKHYQLPVGLLQLGDPMDAVLFTDLTTFTPITTYVDGIEVASEGECLIVSHKASPINLFRAQTIQADDLRIIDEGAEKIRVIHAIDGELVTPQSTMPALVVDQCLEPDPDRDLLLLMVLNRYQRGAKPAMAFVKGFGLKYGAMASTVAHDSHNLIAVGCSREAIALAVNTLVKSTGGISVCDGTTVQSLALPIAGLMSPEPAPLVGQQYSAMDTAAKALGSSLRAPYMTLSFMALLVIPELKLSDKGLFDGKKFAFVPLAADE